MVFAVEPKDLSWSAKDEPATCDFQLWTDEAIWILEVRDRARLFDGNIGKRDVPHGYAPIVVSAMLAGRAVTLVYDHLVNGKLGDIRLLDGHQNFSGVYLNVEELRATVQMKISDEIGAMQCARMLKASVGVVRQLTRLDPPLLPARMQCNPVNLRPQITIATADAKGFFEDYISLSQIRSATSTHGAPIKAALAAECVLPAIVKFASEPQRDAGPSPMA